MQYFLSFDVGTSSIKSILVNEQGKIIASATEHYPLYTPHSGWVEQDPLDYWKATYAATRRMLSDSGISETEVRAMVFTTQAQGIIPVDKQGNVLHRNIIWVDGRAEEQARKAMGYFGGKAVFKAIVGIEITGKDVIPKLIWLKDKHPDVFNNTHKFLDVNGYLKFMCTGRMVAEWSGACSYAFDVKKKDWERLFFKLTRLGTDKLPDLVKSTDMVGKLTEKAAEELGLSSDVEVYGGCDDTQSAAVGTTAIGEGEAHIYTGTSAWLGVSTAKTPKFKNGAVCLQSADPEKNLVVAITESAGANTLWLIDTFYSNEKSQLQGDELFSLIESEVKATPPGAEYLVVTPWFLGERCPVSTTTTRSTIFNLSHQHTRGHIARAHFEGIAYNLRWSIENFEKDFGFNIRELKVTGGGSRNATWMQIIADITQRPVVTTSQPFSAGAMGGVMCAMVGSGVLKGFSDIQQLIQTVDTYYPGKENTGLYSKLFKAYQSLYHQLSETYKEINQERFQF
jgi:xylulokinase